MKRTIKLLVLAAAFAGFVMPVLAQDQCTDDNKAAWYKTFLDNYKGDEAKQQVAYDAAKKYISTCPEDQYSKYMNDKFVVLWDRIHQDQALAKQFDDAVKAKNYSQTLALGKQLVAKNPDNAVVYIIMAGAGLGDVSLLADSAQQAKKAIELIEAGKPFEPAYKTKDQALAAMNYIVAKSLVQNSPADAIPYYLKAAHYESDLKKNHQFYLELADAYLKGPDKDLRAKYKAAVGPNDTETPESKLILENLNQVTDRQIDALARAAANTTDAATKKAILADLTALYKYRTRTATDANVTELVANVMSKPLPEMPTPITSLPGPSPSSTPATNGSGNGNGSSSGSAPMGGTNNGSRPTGNNVTSNTPANGKGATGTGTATGTAQPAASPPPPRKPVI